MAENGFQTLLVELRDHIATITLNRPDVRNAINLKMVEELHLVLDALANNKSVGIVIFTGAGGKAFAAGADIEELKERRKHQALQGINARLFQKVEDFPWPTIAAIIGYAIGGGCELALACDLRICGDSAKLGLPEVSLGIMPAAGALYRLPALVGAGRAKELILTGRILDAKESLSIGLANRVVPDGQVRVEAVHMANEILRQGPLAIRLAKMASRGMSSLNRESFATIENLAQALLFESKDKSRRMESFLEKRNKKAQS